jgi:diamine N-acetyltransferase
MAYIFRIANENDFESIHALNQQFSHFIKTPQKFKMTVEQMKTEQELFKILVVESVSDGIIGFASTFIAWYSWVGKSLYLDDLYILEKYRNSGLGTRLIEEVFQLAKNEGCKKVRWQVSKWNEHAIEFYKRKGAVIDDVEINCDLVF